MKWKRYSKRRKKKRLDKKKREIENNKREKKRKKGVSQRRRGDQKRRNRKKKRNKNSKEESFKPKRSYSLKMIKVDLKRFNRIPRFKLNLLILKFKNHLPLQGQTNKDKKSPKLRKLRFLNLQNPRSLKRKMIRTNLVERKKRSWSTKSTYLKRYNKNKMNKINHQMRVRMRSKMKKQKKLKTNLRIKMFKR